MFNIYVQYAWHDFFHKIILNSKYPTLPYPTLPYLTLPYPIHYFAI